MTEERKKKSGWGIGIFVFYGMFMVFILSLVIFVSIQDIQLVDSDYYAKDLAYQKHIDKVALTNALPEGIKIDVRSDTRHVVLDFPTMQSPGLISGTITLMRPSNARLDRVINISPDDSGNQIISTEGMARGKWNIRIDWKSDTTAYFNEDMIIIQ